MIKYVWIVLILVFFSSCYKQDDWFEALMKMASDAYEEDSEYLEKCEKSR